MRPLNDSDTAKMIKTPFLQALFDYREEKYDYTTYIGFFELSVWGHPIIEKSSDKRYDIKLLTGPETTEAEYALM